MKKGIFEFDFLLAVLVIVVTVGVLLQETDANLQLAAGEKKVFSLEAAALAGSQLLENKCNWSAEECAGGLQKLGAAAEISELHAAESGEKNERHGMEKRKGKDATCVKRIFTEGEKTMLARVCAE